MVETIKTEDEGGESEKKSIEHYSPSVRALVIPKLPSGSCGFHLTRSKWDAYPFVSQVDKESPAEVTGLKAGDCVLEVNCQDVLGLRISEIANLVRAKGESVSLLLWSSGVNPNCSPESLCCGPMPQNLEKLSASMSTILAAMECPICLDTIPPPVIQCQNGHLICAKCRTRSERCPICREKYSPGRSLIAEQIYNSLTDAFKLPNSERKAMREKLFGGKYIKSSDLKYIHIQSIIHQQQQPSHTQKFLARLMGKASSLENLNTIRCAIEEQNLKSSKSQSTTEIFQRDFTPKVGNFRQPPANLSLDNLQTCRHPSSLSNSTESLHNNQITVPQHLKPFKCPLSRLCLTQMNSLEIRSHVMSVHSIPIITFGTDSAEIALPPQQIIENSFLILNLDQLNFWVRLISSEEVFFCSSVVESSIEDEASKFFLEASLTNNEANGQTKHLISRNQVYSLKDYSWDSLLEDRLGVFYKKDLLNSTFSSDNLLLKVKIYKN